MSIFDKIKQAAKDTTGLGLNATEQYNRAYQKGVFLAPPNYKAAAEHFVKASGKFTEEGNQAMAVRANANAALYTLIVAPTPEAIDNAVKTMSQVQQLERIGSQTEMVATGPLVIELRAVQLAAQAEACSAHMEKAVGFKNASQALLKIGNAPLQLTDRLKLPGPFDKALKRAVYYQAFSDYHAGCAKLAESPQSAQDFFQSSTTRFKQAQVSDMESKVGALLQDVQFKRHCWMCGREMQGRNIYFKYYPTSTAPYHNRVVEALQQDAGMIDSPNEVTLCTVCGLAVEAQADAYAVKRMNELREELVPVINGLRNDVNNLIERVNELARMAHTHRG